MEFLRCQVGFYDEKAKTCSMSSQEIENVLEDSPLYFSLPLDERKQMVKRIKGTLEEKQRKQRDIYLTIALKLFINIKDIRVASFFSKKLIQLLLQHGIEIFNKHRDAKRLFRGVFNKKILSPTLFVSLNKQLSQVVKSI